MAPQPESSNNAPNQDHPDAPLPIEQYSDDETRSLVTYEPYPIEDDETEVAAAASRPRHAAHAKLRLFWLKNKGMFLVLLAQMFGASMNVMTQLLEINSSMHPFQILFARMSITAVASYLYMWYARVPAPFGTRPVLFLLITRATFGFLGVYGMYYSVGYLPLAEATVITFLAPIMTCYACSLLIPGETFSTRQQLAALVSLGGVILIAQPFRKREGGNGDSPGSADSYHHVLATIVAFAGVIGAAGAYTSIRMIGRRAHPLVSVTYFSSVTTIISLVAMAAVPGVPFRLPSNTLEWSFMVGLGVCGFLLQFLLTAGLSYVPPAEVSVSKAGQGSRATSMVYTQVVFALFYDKVIWGTTLSLVSAAGSVLILACAIYVAVVQEGRSEPKPNPEEGVDQPRYKDADEEA
ncbi:uncharacterized protein N7484_000185 [Penicillium longicatenatum]|uniref:uncharacterized protein n=1 Tax=Penicillium longicatenatum TaxID=1561947 RepID=UPI0025476F83|nr:uncharacterized protein N7484_000185 [Penicillium longicatenatum]KAJ5660813.1 hypothetical protein N7484_000185 [Penicillium longicatenatum]